MLSVTDEVNRLYCIFLDASYALQVKEFMLHDKRITFQIAKDASSAGNSDDEPVFTLLLTGFKDDREEIIRYFLESNRVSNGGEVTNFSYNKNDQSAIVTFSREESAYETLCAVLCKIA